MVSSWELQIAEIIQWLKATRQEMHVYKAKPMVICPRQHRPPRYAPKPYFPALEDTP